MSKVCRNIIVLLIIVSLSRSAWSSRPDELSDMLARAESLYYEADFAKSVELLLRADEMLRDQPGRIEEKSGVKLQLALGFIGLNDSARAKAYLGELYALDSDRVIDPKMFSPKVITLADEAKAEQLALKCRSLSDEAESLLRAGNGDGVVKLIGSGKAKCSGLSAFYPRAADLVFKEGLDIYKKAQMPQALQKFHAALALEPRHELAAQYIELTESKLELNAERALLVWRKNFTAGDFEAAKRDYRDLSSEAGSEASEEYRVALSNLVDSWNRACAANDAATMETVRVQVNRLRPDPAFGADILARMKTCAPIAGCIQMDTQLALTRLKTRVDPVLSTEMKAQIKIFPVRFIVKARINEKGEVDAVELEGGHPVLYNVIRSAVSRWKFTPAVTQDGPRCVDTEIPLIINLN
jgi:hypothetical protein